MALEIKPSIERSLPSSVKLALSKMPSEVQATFEEEYAKKKRSVLWILFLAVVFPIQHFLLGKSGLGLIFWLTGGGCFIWYFIEIFLAPSRVKSFNEDQAKVIFRDIKIMNN